MALIVKIGANMSSFDKQMKKLTREVNTVGNKLKNAGATLTTAVTLPIAGIGLAATKTGMEFEAAMSKVGAISGATGDELAQLEAKAREMGASTQFSASEAADALSYMAMAGWKTEDMLSGIDGVMSLAAASGEDLATVSDIVTDALTAFGMSAQDSGRFADVLASASSNANTNVSMLGESFKMVAPVAGSLGYSVEDTTKALALMANAGIKGSASGTALRTMMTNLAKPTKAMQDAMDELGISLTDSDGNMKTLDQVMHDLRGSFDGLSESQQASYAATIFGKEAMSGALAVINSSSTDYDKLTNAINNSEGAASEMAETMNDNLSGRLKEMKSAFEEMGIVIYNNLKPALETIVQAVKGVADWFNSLSPSTQNLIFGLAGLAAAVGPLLIAIGAGIMLFAKLKATLAILQVSFIAISWPILAVIAALAGIVAVVVYWEQIKTFFINLWAYLKNLFFQSVEYIRNVFQGLYDKAKPIIDAIGNVLSAGWNFIKTVTLSVFNFISSYIKAVWDAIWFFIGPTVTKIVATITEKWNKAKAITSTVLNAMKTVVTNIFNTIKSTASSVWNALISVISVPVQAIKSKVTSAFEGMKSTILGVWTGIKTGLKVIINGIIKLINKFIGKFNGPAKLLNKIPGVSAPIIPDIPMLAKGGNVLGSGTFITGEAGPELMEKSGSSIKVTPLSSQEKANGINGALGGKGKIEIPLFLDGYEIARATYDHINGMLESDASSKLFFSGVR